MTTPCIGIDLGTTYSCVGVWRNGKVEICPNDQGNRITPSYVAWTDDGERLIGDAAKNQAASNPGSTVYDAKRLIGRKFSDPTVQRDAKLLPFKLCEIKGKTNIEVDIKGKKSHFIPEEVSAMVLGKMKETAEAFLGCEVCLHIHIYVYLYCINSHSHFCTSSLITFTLINISPYILLSYLKSFQFFKI
jgi:molecular chaperone DnaK (HSP70)